MTASLLARTCSASGDMIWSKDELGDDKFAMCYAPSLVEESPGPTSGHFECDKGTKFTADVPKFCCHNPRMQNAMTGMNRVTADNEVCGDMLAEFDNENQRIRFTGGPSGSFTYADLAKLQDAGYGEIAPSPLALKAMHDGWNWKNASRSVCLGKSGTMIRDGKDYEFCPTGTQPMKGPEYASWLCDGLYTHQSKLHCCSLKGQTRCVKNFVDRSGVDECHVNAFGDKAEVPDSEALVHEGRGLLLFGAPHWLQALKNSRTEPQRRQRQCQHQRVRGQMSGFRFM